MVQQNFWSKKFCFKKNLGPKICWLSNNVRPKKFCPKTFLDQKSFIQNIILGKFWVKEIESKKILVNKMLSPKKFQVQNNLGNENFQFQKILFLKNLGSKIGSQKNQVKKIRSRYFGSKKLWVQKNDVQQNFGSK